MTENSFWNGNWYHVMPVRKEERVDVIRRLCFGPLETEILGLKDGKPFRENRCIEGIEEGGIVFSYISQDAFLEEIEYEIRLSVDHHCRKRADLLRSIKESLA